MITHGSLLLGLAEGGGFNPLAYDPAAMILTLVTFFGLLFILAKFAWGPILKAVEAREGRIEGAIRQAELDRAEAAKLMEDYKQTIANVQAESAALREKGQQEAEAVRRDLLAKAGAEAAEIAGKARREIELARSQALQDIRREAVTLGLAVAGRVVGRDLDGNDQRRLAEEVVGNLSAVEGNG
ncbi:MAG: F0F1 ATP synthase subunit B [Planctomycetota bacterium]